MRFLHYTNFTKHRSENLKQLSDVYIYGDCQISGENITNFISMHIVEGEKSMKVCFDKEIAIKLRKELNNAIDKL